MACDSVPLPGNSASGGALREGSSTTRVGIAWWPVVAVGLKESLC